MTPYARLLAGMNRAITLTRSNQYDMAEIDAVYEQAVIF